MSVLSLAKTLKIYLKREPEITLVHAQACNHPAAEVAALSKQSPETEIQFSALIPVGFVRVCAGRRVLAGCGQNFVVTVQPEEDNGLSILHLPQGQTDKTDAN